MFKYLLYIKDVKHEEKSCPSIKCFTFSWDYGCIIPTKMFSTGMDTRQWSLVSSFPFYLEQGFFPSVKQCMTHCHAGLKQLCLCCLSDFITNTVSRGCGSGVFLHCISRPLGCCLQYIPLRFL